MKETVILKLFIFEFDYELDKVVIDENRRIGFMWISPDKTNYRIEIRHLGEIKEDKKVYEIVSIDKDALKNLIIV